MHRIDPQDDRGASLLEVVVAMALLSIFMGIFTVSTLMMTRTTVKIQNLVETSQQSNNGFLALERAVRYSTGITEPRRDNGTWNVEFAWQDKNAGAAANRCTQLRVSGTVLQQRSWSITSAGAGMSLTPWRTLASGVTNGSSLEGDTDRPFKPVKVGSDVAASQAQGIVLTVITARGTGRDAAMRRSSTTFTALNTTSPGWDERVCTQYGLTEVTP